VTWIYLFNLLRRHWRGVALVLLVALAFGAGWFCRPDVVKTVEVERVVEKVVEVERVVTKIEKQAAQVQRVVVYRDRVVTPDGTTREREIETSEAATVQREQVAQVHDRTAEQTTERAVEKVIDPRRNWRASVLVGVQSLRDRRPVFGLRVERRLLGDVSLGLWGLNSGEVGGSLGFDF
jgi:ribosomal protein L39E